MKLIRSIDLKDVELISLDHDLGDEAMQEYFRKAFETQKNGHFSKNRPLLTLFKGS